MKYYRLKKSNDWQKKGAIFFRDSEANNRDSELYKWIPNKADLLHSDLPESWGTSSCLQPIRTIENNPEWYEEVFAVIQKFATAEEIKKLKLKKVKL